MKILKMLILGMVILFAASCGDDDDKGGALSLPNPDMSLTRNDVIGVWETSDGQFKSDSCNLREMMEIDLDEKDYFSVTSGSGDALLLASCEDETCTELEKMGEYKFTASMTIQYGNVVNLGNELGQEGVECELHTVIESQLVFSSDHSGGAALKATTKAIGKDCETIKSFLKSVTDVPQYYFKILDGSCEMSYSATIKKQ